MYLKRFRIKGIKCFDSVEITFPHRGDDYSGWVVLLGGNGTGKSTLLQAMALTLVGPLAGQRLLRPEGWVGHGGEYGEIEAEIVKGGSDSQLGQPRKRPYTARFAITGNQVVELEGQPYDQPQLVHLDTATTRKALASGPYSVRRPGWFACGYGPFRRLSGGDAAEAKLVYSQGREARFATLFRESAALTQCQDWLTQLYSRSIDPANPERERDDRNLTVARQVINDLLPGGIRIEKIDTATVYFRTVGNATVPVPDLSDGYRSFLSLAIDILRHVQESNAGLESLAEPISEGMSILVEGVVLIDEVDVHLHPTWQRSIGFALRRAFPKIQFVVTSHSPFVAQAATKDGLIVLHPKKEGNVGVVTPVASVAGWRVSEILTSPLFGLDSTRDEVTEAMILRHRDLVAERTYETLTPAKQRELTDLETSLAERLTAPGDTPEERQRTQEMMEYVRQTVNGLGDGR